MKDFKDYLQDKHTRQYIGLDDKMGEAFGEWIRELDVQEVLDYVDAWIRIRDAKLITDILKEQKPYGGDVDEKIRCIGFNGGLIEAANIIQKIK